MIEFIEEFETEEKTLKNIKFIKDFLFELKPWQEEILRTLKEKKQAEDSYHARIKEN